MEKYQVHRIFFCKSSSSVGERIYAGPNKTRKWKHRTIWNCFHCFLWKFFEEGNGKVENVFWNQTMIDMINNFVNGKDMSDFSFSETDLVFKT